MNRGGRYNDSQRAGGYGGQGNYQEQPRRQQQQPYSGGNRYQGAGFANRRPQGGIQNKFRNQQRQRQNNNAVVGQRRIQRNHQIAGNQGQNQGQRNNERQGTLRTRGGVRSNAYREGGATNFRRRQLQTNGGQQRLGLNQRSKRIGKIRRQPIASRNTQSYSNRRTLGLRTPRTQQNVQRTPSQQRQSATGNIYIGQVKLPDFESLKNLQVKAELKKLGEIPRAYNDKLNLDSMQVDNHPGRLTLDQRFNRIQGVRPTRPNVNGGRAKGKTLRLVNRPKQAGSRRY
ncbi:UNKNOWN [Stylonychia lemnae]|uniref:Uncharacterized protein n=1 Tax=Stylonychia lemnae TaxID=5949 RepID=A0A078AEA7_STYLE|nr:UNKNOWN [Stylonychia lemnae]|eukprot:CDW80171.1 UNKNOWN [Stylonychia lemnae]